MQQDSLTLINRLRNLHDKTESQLTAIEKSINDGQAASILEHTRGEAFMSRPGGSAHEQLLKDLEVLADGLREHFLDEIPDFVTLFERHGAEIFTVGLLSDHEEILNIITQLQQRVREKSWQGKDLEQGLAEEYQLSSAISRLRTIIEVHSHKESTLLDLIEKTVKK